MLSNILVIVYKQVYLYNSINSVTETSEGCESYFDA